MTNGSNGWLVEVVKSLWVSIVIVRMLWGSWSWFHVSSGTGKGQSMEPGAVYQEMEASPEIPDDSRFWQKKPKGLHLGNLDAKFQKPKLHLQNFDVAPCFAKSWTKKMQPAYMTFRARSRLDLFTSYAGPFSRPLKISLPSSHPCFGDSKMSRFTTKMERFSRGDSCWHGLIQSYPQFGG